jgi:hypothetical protein
MLSVLPHIVQFMSSTLVEIFPVGIFYLEFNNLRTGCLVHIHAVVVNLFIHIKSRLYSVHSYLVYVMSGYVSIKSGFLMYNYFNFVYISQGINKFSWLICSGPHIIL